MTRTDPALTRVLPAGSMEGVPLERYLAVAAEVGFDAVSFRPAAVRTWTATTGRSACDLATLVDDHGLVVAELDPVAGWHDPTGWTDGRLPTEVVADLDLAHEVGARAVTALVLPGEVWVPELGRAGLAALAEAARARHLVVQLEPFGWSSLWDLEEAAELAAGCGGAGVGVMVDTWHLGRRGGGASTVDRVPIALVAGVQLSDGPAAPRTDDLAVDARTARQLPGAPGGELAPHEVLASLCRRGWTGPVGVEVFGDASEDPLERARSMADALEDVVRLAERTIDG